MVFRRFVCFHSSRGLSYHVFFSQNFGGVEMSRKVVVFGDCVFCLTPYWGKIPVLILIFQMS